jgi:hypothetical protein
VSGQRASIAGPGRGAAQRGPRHAPRVPFALLLTGLIVGGLALLLLLNTESAANEVRRHDLAVRDASITAQLQELRNEVAASAAPGNLARAAAALGMVPDANPAFLVIGADGAIRVLGKPAPASQLVVAQQPARHSSPKPTPTPKPTPRTTTRTSTAAPGTRHSTSPAHGRTAKTSSSAPKPSPTPTPTVTLPGGNR